jgi:hypothetical protein
VRDLRHVRHGEDRRACARVDRNVPGREIDPPVGIRTAGCRVGDAALEQHRAVEDLIGLVGIVEVHRLVCRLSFVRRELAQDDARNSPLRVVDRALVDALHGVKQARS